MHPNHQQQQAPQHQLQQSQQPQSQSNNNAAQPLSARSESAGAGIGPGPQLVPGTQSVSEASLSRPKRVNSIAAQINSLQPTEGLHSHHAHHSHHFQHNPHQHTPGRPDPTSSVDNHIQFTDVDGNDEVDDDQHNPRGHTVVQSDNLGPNEARYDSPVGERSVIHNQDDVDSTYHNQYSINATVVKSNPRHSHMNPGFRFKVGLPLSNNEMHLIPRDNVMASPTVSRYSAAALPQHSHSHYVSTNQQTAAALPGLYPHYPVVGQAAIPAMSQHTPLMPSGGAFYHHGRAAGAPGGPHNQQHTMHSSHHMPSFEGPPVHAAAMLQHHELYERDNVGKEMLNLSSSQHSATPTSFKMTSPFYDSKQVAKEVYSRYDLKLEAEHRSSKSQFNQNNPGQPSSALEENSYQHQDGASRERRDQKNHSGASQVGLSADPGAKDNAQAILDTPSSSHRKSNFQQLNQTKMGGELRQRFKDQSPNKVEQNQTLSNPTGDQDRNLPRKQIGANETGGGALPNINDQRSSGQTGSYHQRRDEQSMNTPPTTKQGTTTVREETNTDRGILQSGEKTSRQTNMGQATSSDDRQNSDALIANTRKDYGAMPDQNKQIKLNQMAGKTQKAASRMPHGENASVSSSAQFAPDKQHHPDHSHDSSRRFSSSRHRGQQAVRKKHESSSYDTSPDRQVHHRSNAQQHRHEVGLSRDSALQQHSSGRMHQQQAIAQNQQSRLSNQRIQAISSKQSLYQQTQTNHSKKKATNKDAAIEQSMISSQVNRASASQGPAHPVRHPQGDSSPNRGAYPSVPALPQHHPQFYEHMYYGHPSMHPMDQQHAAAQYHAQQHYPHPIHMAPHFYGPPGHQTALMDQHPPLYHHAAHQYAAHYAAQMHHLHHPHHQSPMAPMHHPYPHEMSAHPQYATAYHHRQSGPQQPQGSKGTHPKKAERTKGAGEAGAEESMALQHQHRSNSDKKQSESPWAASQAEEASHHAQAVMHHHHMAPVPSPYHHPHMYQGHHAGYPGHMMMMHPHHGAFMPPQHYYAHPHMMPPGQPMNAYGNPYYAWDMAPPNQQSGHQQAESQSQSKVDEKSEQSRRSSPDKSNKKQRNQQHQFPQYQNQMAIQQQQQPQSVGGDKQRDRNARRQQHQERPDQSYNQMAPTRRLGDHRKSDAQQHSQRPFANTQRSRDEVMMADREDESFRSPPKILVSRTITPSDNHSLSNATSLNNYQQHNPQLNRERRDLKSNQKFTERLNRTLQQHDVSVAHHISASACQSSVKRQGGSKMGRDTSVTPSRMLPPSLSPAPRSHAEILTSNHKSAGSMAKHQKANESQLQSQRLMDNRRSPLQDVEAQVIGIAPLAKRPNKTPQTLHEQANQQQFQIQPDDQLDGDFRETPSSLFGRKAGQTTAQQLGNTATGGHQTMADRVEKAKISGTQKKSSKARDANHDQTGGGTFSQANQDSVARMSNNQNNEGEGRPKRQRQQAIPIAQPFKQKGGQHEMSSASAGKAMAAEGGLGATQLNHVMLTPNLSSKNKAPGQQTQNQLNPQSLFFEQPLQSDSSAMKLQENPTAQLTSRTISSQQSAYGGPGAADMSNHHQAASALGRPTQHVSGPPPCSDFVEEAKIPIALQNQDSLAPMHSSMENSERNDGMIVPATATQQQKQSRSQRGGLRQKASPSPNAKKVEEQDLATSMGRDPQ